MSDHYAEGEPRRALSAKCEPVTWPPAVGDRIHYNSGWAGTSWSAEVRAVIDDEVAVIAKWKPTGKGRSGRRYDLLDRIAVMVWGNPKSGCLWKGPLPKGVAHLKDEQERED